MSIIFSRTCEYGIQAVLYLSKHFGEQNPVQLREISSTLGIPYHFLSKIMQTLVHHDLVLSHKGVNGGFELRKAPSNVRLIDIVRALDGDAFVNHCVLGLPNCNQDSPCAVHQNWIQAKFIILEMLCVKTITDLRSEQEALAKALRNTPVQNNKN